MFRMAAKQESYADRYVLDVGCGYSNILESLYKLGYDKLVGIDWCDDIIRRQKNKYSQIGDNMNFFKMDA